MKSNRDNYLDLREREISEWSIQDYQEWFEANEWGGGYNIPTENKYADVGAKMSQLLERNSADNV